MFFLSRRAPLSLRAEAIHALRLSLNAPVLAAEGLPESPARAAIVAHAEPDGRTAVTVAVRSLPEDRVALFSGDGDLGEQGGVPAGVEAALGFAEAMGFLFGEDELGEGPDAGEHALARWREWIAAAGAAADPAPPAAPDAETEILLEELAPEVPQPPLSKFRTPAGAAPASAAGPTAEAAADPAPRPAPGPAVGPRRGRRAEPAAASGAPAGRAALGRVRLVRRDGQGRGWLERLLAAF